MPVSLRFVVESDKMATEKDTHLSSTNVLGILDYFGESVEKSVKETIINYMYTDEAYIYM